MEPSTFVVVILLAVGWILLFGCARSLDRHYPRLVRRGGDVASAGWWRDDNKPC